MWKMGRNKERNKGGPVGTEAVALANIKKNSKNFRYPEPGFETRIEHSLLYNMISEPKVYPESAIRDLISKEDFSVYMIVVQKVDLKPNNMSSLSKKEEDKDQIISYAQLSAILALTSENFRLAASDCKKAEGRGPQQQFSEEQNIAQPNIPDLMCKAVLQHVIRYVNEHNLDRQAEIQELLRPVQRHTEKRSRQAGLKYVVPFYIGYGISMATLNPVPMLVGAALMSGMGDEYDEEAENIKSFKRESDRRSDVEKTGLLDETDDI